MFKKYPDSVPWKNKEWLENEYLVLKKSAWAIGKELKESGLYGFKTISGPVTVVSYGLKKFGIKTRTRGEALTLRLLREPIKNLGPKHKSWKGGTYITSRGKGLTKYRYVYDYSPDAKPPYHRPEHILIAEKLLGRKLKPGEIVHHINGDGLDNRNDNLLLCDRSYHRWLHDKMGKLYMEEHFEKGVDRGFIGLR